jgi:CubicO group peptidase (beta-lactamase class C family)
MRRAPITLAVFSLAGLLSCSRTPSPEEYWPAAQWRASEPAAQGMDGSALARIDSEFAAGKHHYIDGMLVIRDGHAVFERTYRHDYDALFAGKDPRRGPYNYYDPDWHPYYERGDLHTLQSVTKSVTSALIGIAIGRGEIAGVDARLLSFFDEGTVANVDERKRAVTLRDLLTMTAGFRWDEETLPYTDPGNDAAVMEAGHDWVRYVVDKPMEHEPGKVFRYSSGVTQILSHILFRVTGKHADEYAREHLFAPIGIEKFYWKKTPTGHADTEGGLYLTAHDLARFGYLYLKDGVWNGKRILPEGWVRSTMQPLADAGSGDSPGWRYGYQWWLVPDPRRARDATVGAPGGDGAYIWACFGYGGQRLLIVPDLELIAVFTGWNIYEHPALDTGFAVEGVLGAVQAPVPR